VRTYGVPRALERPRRRDPPAARDGGDVEKAVQIAAIAAAAGAPEPPTHACAEGSGPATLHI